LYDLSLLEKPAILAVNKIDLLTDEEKKKIKVNLDMPSVKISALTGVGIKELLNIISRKLEKGKLQEKEEIKIGAF